MKVSPQKRKLREKEEASPSQFIEEEKD